MIQDDLEEIQEMFDANLYKEDNDQSDDDSEGEEDDVTKEEEEQMKKEFRKAQVE